jgi:hypothetical protein
MKFVRKNFMKMNKKRRKKFTVNEIFIIISATFIFEIKFDPSSRLSLNSPP